MCRLFEPYVESNKYFCHQTVKGKVEICKHKTEEENIYYWILKQAQAYRIFEQTFCIIIL